MAQKDYYKIMGLNKGASEKDIKMAYRRLARKYHPDISKEPNAEEKFKELGEAYEVLKDPEKRRLYDLHGENWQHAAGGGFYQQQQHHQHEANPNFSFDGDIFEAIFGSRHKARESLKGHDLYSDVEITLEEAYSGCQKDLKLQDENNKINTVKVKIPAGIKSNQQIRLTGLGGKGPTLKQNGDLYLRVHIHKHPLFSLKNNDIYLTLPIAPWEAALGALVKVPTLKGAVELKIPPASTGGQTLRLKGRGMPGKVVGDQFIILKIVIPVPINDSQRELYKTMQATMAFNPRQNLGV